MLRNELLTKTRIILLFVAQNVETTKFVLTGADETAAIQKRREQAND